MAPCNLRWVWCVFEFSLLAQQVELIIIYDKNPKRQI